MIFSYLSKRICKYLPSIIRSIIREISTIQFLTVWIIVYSTHLVRSFQGFNAPCKNRPESLWKNCRKLRWSRHQFLIGYHCFDDTLAKEYLKSTDTIRTWKRTWILHRILTDRDARDRVRFGIYDLDVSQLRLHKYNKTPSAAAISRLPQRAFILLLYQTHILRQPFLHQFLANLHNFSNIRYRHTPFRKC